MRRWELVLIAGLAVGVLCGIQLAHWPHHMPSPEAQEVGDEGAESKVSEDQLNLFISVYTEMQADHDLTLDKVLAERGVSLEEFRDIERHVQSEQRLVDRVRTALLNQAKSRSSLAGPVATPTPSSSAGQTPR